MKVDKTLVKHVADVARLSLTEKEAEKFVPQLQEILDSFAILNSIDVTGVAPSFHPIPVKNHTRKDIAKKSLHKAEALKNAVHKQDGYFKGPRAV